MKDTIYKLNIFHHPSKFSQEKIIDFDCLTIGISNKCDIFIPDLAGDLKYSIKIQIEKIEDFLIISVLDPLFAINKGDKSYRKIKINRNANLSFGDIKIDFEQVTYQLSGEGTLEIDLGFKPEANTESSLPPPVVSVPRSDLPRHGPIEEKSRQSTPIASTLVWEFETKFEEHLFSPIFTQKFLNREYEYSHYIELEDNTCNSPPVQTIASEINASAIHISHLNNGIVLDEKYFFLENKKVFLSSKSNGKNYFCVHDCEQSKFPFIKMDKNAVLVNKLPGFDLYRVRGSDCLRDTTVNTVKLSKEDRLVFTKGTSQIIINFTERSPSLLSTESFLDIDEKFLKVFSTALVSLFIPFLLLLTLVDVPELKEKKPEQIVIYKVKRLKMKKPQAEEKSTKVVESAPKPKAAEQLPKVEEIKKSPEPVKPIKTKRVVQNKPKPRPKSQTPKSKPQVSKVKPRPSPKKQRKQPVKNKYAFNSSASLKAISSSTLQNQFAADTSQTNINLAVGNSQSNLTDTSRTVANVNIKSKGFNTSKGFNKEYNSARGLSSKSHVETSYMESQTKVLGSIDPELIRKLMREYIPQFRYCYQQELLSNEGIEGVFDINFQINPRGKGVNVYLSNTRSQFSRKGQNCIKKVISLIAFPKPSGNSLVDVKQPLNFSKN